MRVRWTNSARKDLRRIIAYIKADNPGAAVRMKARFDHVARILAQSPKAGRSGALPGTREFVAHPSYRLVYEVDEDEVVILTLVHTARQWPPDEA